MFEDSQILTKPKEINSVARLLEWEHKYTGSKQNHDPDLAHCRSTGYIDAPTAQFPGSEMNTLGSVTRQFIWLFRISLPKDS